MKIWYSKDQGPDDSSWVWVKSERGVINWIKAGATALSLPKEEGDLIQSAKDAKIKVSIQP